jgi:ankyrin repeat protein
LDVARKVKQPSIESSKEVINNFGAHDVGRRKEKLDFQKRLITKSSKIQAKKLPVLRGLNSDKLEVSDHKVGVSVKKQLKTGDVGLSSAIVRDIKAPLRNTKQINKSTEKEKWPDSDADAKRVFDRLEVVNRGVYDYRRTVLPSNINKIEYGENNVHLPRVFYSHEYSALLFDAVEKGDINGIKALLAKRADINVRRSGDGLTPLMYAVKEGQLKVSRYLIVRGADVNIKNFASQTAVYMAIMDEQFEMVRVLLSGRADLSSVDKNHLRPCRYLTDGILQDNEFVRKILEAYKDFDEAIVDFVYLGSVYGVQYALRLGADINSRDDLLPHDTLLMIAARRGDIAMVNFLLAVGADVKAKNLKGETVSVLAKQMDNEDIVNVIKTVLFEKDLQVAIKHAIEKESKTGDIKGKRRL